MSYGIRVWGPTGLLELDENSFTVRVVYSGLVTKNAPANSGARSVLISIPGVTVANHAAVCLAIGDYASSTTEQSPYVCQFEPQVVAGGVRVWFGNRLQSSGMMGIGTQRLLVMRYA